MENFFYDDEFYSEICDLLEAMDIEDGKENEQIEDDWSIECFESVLEPLVTLNYDWIVDRVNEERFPEDNDRVSQQFSKAIESIDFTKANELMPKMYYQTRKKFTITKADILEYIA